MRNEKCFECLFFKNIDSNRGDGECHCNPPIPNYRTREGIFPIVKGDNWCGDYTYCKKDQYSGEVVVKLGEVK